MLYAYEVLGPEYTVEETIPGLASGPRHDTRDYLRVFARNQERAKVVAVRVWRGRGERPYSARRRHERSVRWTPHPGYWWGDTNWKNPFGMLDARRVGPVKDVREIMRRHKKRALEEHKGGE